MASVPLALNFAQGRSSIGGGGGLVNMFAQSAPVGAKADTLLIGAPGARAVARLRYLNDENDETPESDILAMIPAFDRLVVVGAHAVYLVTKAGAVTRLGASQLTAPVQLASNGTDVIAVDGNRNRALWITATGISPVYPTAAAFYSADSVCFLDGYLILNRRGTGQVFCSGIYARTFNGLDFAGAEKSPDNTVGVLASGEYLWIFGAATTEVWYNAANPVGFPFSRVSGATIEQGCAAINTARQMDGLVFWLTAGGL